MNSTPTRRHVLLWGMMGSGKTTVGPLLAARLNQAYLDLDEAIESSMEMSVADIFTHYGEAGFRQRERSILLDHLSSTRPETIALGGGALVDPEIRAIAREHAFVICLWAKPETLANRVGNGHGRPLVGNDVEESLQQILAQRAEAYSDVDLVVATDIASPDSIAKSIANALLSEEAA